jgi:hypothetical protein
VPYEKTSVAEQADDAAAILDALAATPGGDAGWDGLPAPVRQVFIDNGPPSVAELNGLLQVDQAALTSIDQPTLLVAAADSPAFFRQVTDAMAAAVANSRLAAPDRPDLAKQLVRTALVQQREQLLPGGELEWVDEPAGAVAEHHGAMEAPVREGAGDGLAGGLGIGGGGPVPAGSVACRLPRPGELCASPELEGPRRAGSMVERVTGIEPASRAWKARALPLSYTRVGPVPG